VSEFSYPTPRHLLKNEDPTSVVTHVQTSIRSLTFAVASSAPTAPDTAVPHERPLLKRVNSASEVGGCQEKRESLGESLPEISSSREGFGMRGEVTSGTEAQIHFLWLNDPTEEAAEKCIRPTGNGHRGL